MVMATEEVLFTLKSNPDEPETSIMFISQSDGNKYLRIQAGASHKRAINRARGILKTRGLVVGNPTIIGLTGTYYSILPDSGSDSKQEK
jgi:hypothetical protein